MIRKKENRFIILAGIIIGIVAFNPMLGFRGCRLAIVHPEIIRMQAEVIMRAAIEVKRENKYDIVHPSILLWPLRTRRGVNEPARSRGTSISKGPTSESMVLVVVPLRALPRADVVGSPFS